MLFAIALLSVQTAAAQMVGTPYIVPVLSAGTLIGDSVCAPAYPSMSGPNQEILFTRGSVTTVGGAFQGNGTYSYQWQRSTDNSTWTDVGSAAASLPATYAYPSTANLATDTISAWYRYKVTSAGETAYSNSAPVMVRKPVARPTIILNDFGEQGASSFCMLDALNGGKTYTIKFSIPTGIVDGSDYTYAKVETGGVSHKADEVGYLTVDGTRYNILQDIKISGDNTTYTFSFSDLSGMNDPNSYLPSYYNGNAGIMIFDVRTVLYDAKGNYLCESTQVDYTIRLGSPTYQRGGFLNMICTGPGGVSGYPYY